MNILVWFVCFNSLKTYTHCSVHHTTTNRAPPCFRDAGYSRITCPTPVPFFRAFSLNQIMCTWEDFQTSVLYVLHLTSSSLRTERRKKMCIPQRKSWKGARGFFFSTSSFCDEPVLKHHKAIHLKSTSQLKCLMDHKTLAFFCQWLTFKLVSCQVLHGRGVTT